jgi:hypothetical protein
MSTEIGEVNRRILKREKRERNAVRNASGMAAAFIEKSQCHPLLPSHQKERERERERERNMRENLFVCEISWSWYE